LNTGRVMVGVVRLTKLAFGVQTIGATCQSKNQTAIRKYPPKKETVRDGNQKEASLVGGNKDGQCFEQLDGNGPLDKKEKYWVQKGRGNFGFAKQKKNGEANHKWVPHIERRCRGQCEHGEN